MLPCELPNGSFMGKIKTSPTPSAGKMAAKTCRALD